MKSPLESAAPSLQQAVLQISSQAAAIDEAKFAFPDAVMRQRVLDAVESIHAVAEFYDRLHGFGAYAPSDESQREAA